LRKDNKMLVLEKWLRVLHIKGADLNCRDAWAIVFKDNSQAIIGHDHSKNSTVLLNEVAREKMGFPILTELANRMISIRLTQKELSQVEGEEDWVKPLWTTWREDVEACSKVFLAGLERHEYVEYSEQTDFGEGGSETHSQLSDQDKARRLTVSTVAEKKSVLIAYFSSSVPSGYSGPSMGMAGESRYPVYHFAVSVSQEEYDELSTLLERPITFEVEIQIL
jgi:hypothetical protein